ncbi:hypothetical protein [Nonomuraea basaltis]|uniref:hypothetical protein n=1 Tax=Nonomuraea basaltis TaxID=2495887 RepID=UPI00110C6D93|nr:hypothetical protein [Nonomuraea basaltis]TMR89913.1 hypothetical protein EJK15_58230 [Nonomuraea basaltis]
METELAKTRGTLPGPITYVVLAVWVGVVVTAIFDGVFGGEGLGRLALPAAVFVPVAAVVVAYLASARFRSYLLDLDRMLVLAVQMWRVIGIAFLFALAFGQLPAGFAVPAGVGDIATGLAAVGVVMALSRGRLTRRRFYAFTALGVTDFLVAFAVGLPLAPPGLVTWPLALYPAFMVPLFLILHLISVLQSMQITPSQKRSNHVVSR